MTLAVAVLAGMAAWCWLPPARSRRLAPAPPTRAASRRRPVLPALALVAVVVLLCGIGWGAIGITVALVVALTGCTALVSLLRWRQRAAVRRRREEVGQACDALAAQLGLGQSVAAALRTVAAECPVLSEAAAVVGLGGSPVPVWRRQSREQGADALLDLARAWQVAVAAGGPMGPTLQRMGEQLRRDRELQRMVETELGTARMTGQLLVGLPVVGLALGAGLGGDPVAFLLGHVVGQICLVAGVLLACLGLLWTEALARVPGLTTEVAKP